ncbi:MAG: poly-gamma-glutamate synthase PgsB [Rectinemataceae bacterium]
MNSLSVLGGALAFVSALGIAERAALWRARNAVPIRIHVNGTRGKSTTARLIRAALCEGGIPALSKTTGTTPRYVLPDGSEETIDRRSQANVREQMDAVKRAKRAGARALVVECMALNPEFQWVSERRMIRSTIGVITNARLDHVETMGRSVGEIAATLGNTVPEHGTLIVGDPFVARMLAGRAAALGTELRLAPPAPSGLREGAPAWWMEDAGIALEVARSLGLSDDVAFRGMRKAEADPGAVRELDLAGGFRALDASAANDPDSLLELVDEDGGRERPLLFVYNHRVDRTSRLASFIAASLPGDFIVTGDAPGTLLLKRLAGGGAKPDFVPRRGLETSLAARLDAAVAAGKVAPRVVFCGNTKGWRIPGAGIAPERISS